MSSVDATQPTRIMGFQVGYWLIIPFIFIAVIFVMFFSPSFVEKAIVTSPGPYDLSKESTVVKIEDSNVLVTGSEATFQAFVYFNPLMRTGTYGACGTNPNQPSCADGTFGPCPCDAASGDCGSCAHSGYQPVFNLNGLATLEVLTVPDASRQGQAMVQLIVKTEGKSLTSGSTATQKYIETLSLPSIKLQSWTMFTVAREGRRFDVYYNDKIVLSKQTLNMPISSLVASNLRGVVSGSPSLVGVLTNATVAPKRYTIQDVQASYIQLADTRGQPYIIPDKNAPPSTIVSNLTDATSASGVLPTVGSSMLPSFSGISIPCITTNCFSAPTVRPPNPLYDWSSPYA